MPYKEMWSYTFNTAVFGVGCLGHSCCTATECQPTLEERARGKLNILKELTSAGTWDSAPMWKCYPQLLLNLCDQEAELSFHINLREEVCCGHTCCQVFVSYEEEHWPKRNCTSSTSDNIHQFQTYILACHCILACCFSPIHAGPTSIRGLRTAISVCPNV